MTPRDLRAEWRSGKDHGFPVCCIARFCWDLAWGREPALMRPGTVAGYVPCAVFHHVSPDALWFTIHRGDHFAAIDVDDETGEVLEIIERDDPRWAP